MNSEQLTAMLVPFYLGEQPDSAGRTIEDIWAWDFENLECTHDYIQWLFPIDEQSRFNINAPVIDADLVLVFQRDRRLQQNLRRSFAVMLRFYGLQSNHSETNKIEIERSPDYLIRKQEWLNLFNHNYLRITRILKCLMTFGLMDEARAFYECLQQIYREDSNLIGSETFQYWTNAVKITK
jgi:Opioid growth factor receptor (OGFr) conserved region